MNHTQTLVVAIALLVPASIAAQAPGATGNGGPAAARAASRGVAEQTPAARPAGEAPTTGTASARTGQAQAPAARVASHTLSSTRKVFADTDTDKDGIISEREATVVGVSKAQFRAFDSDGDAKITADEFVVGYRQLVAEAGHAAAADLEAEATRLQSLRRAQAAQSERQRQGRVGGDPAADSSARRVAGAEATPERVRAASGATAPTGRAQDSSRDAATGAARESGRAAAGSDQRGSPTSGRGERTGEAGQRPAPAERGAGASAPAPSRPTQPPSNSRPAPQPRPQQPAPRPPATPRPAPRPSGPSRG